MGITIKILKRSPGGRPTLYATRDFDKLPVSIGRDAACAICLEDPNKHMSRFHVEIEEEGGTYWMAVVSKVNAVMVKGQRYGPGTRLTLQSGDSFELAEYEVQVMLPEAAPELPPSAAPAAKPPAADAERLFNESTFFGDDEPAPRKPIPPGADGAPPEETFIPQKRSLSAPAAVASAPNALRAFFEGASVPYKELSAVDSERMLREGGAILRAAIDGIMMLLLARAEMRKEFGAGERTLIASHDNNPLKRMSDPHQAMDFLLNAAERTGGLLDPVQAVGDTFEDLRTHQLALMAGMRAAIQGALRRLEPDAVERVFEKSQKGFSLASRKARLWQLFVLQQARLSRDVQEDFNKVFGSDFIAAYQAELARIKGER